MKLVLGLGNPGPKYETTRHNVGYLALDRLVDDWGARGPENRFQAQVWKADWAGEPVLLAKPQTFMNLSGRSVGPLAEFHKIAPEDIVVIHDDLDLEPMSLRVKTGGGAGGHNGLKSIDAALGAARTGYHRVRIGIGHPRSSAEVTDEDARHSHRPVADYVLDLLTDSELEALDATLDRAREAVELCLSGRAERAMELFNRRQSPVRE